MPIHILDDVTINQIAAGEVIERPSSALKELMENAFDAGATKIEAAFEEGGKTILKVTDNGCGITPEDLPLAMQRHATSKINSAEDLFSLKTMGFRGEALASIGAVSDLILSSTVPGTSVGSRIYTRGGELGPIEPCAPLPGTQIEIKNLFYNVPARQKFLKSTAGETAALKKVFSNFALAHPHIQLTLRQDQKVIMQFLPQSFFKRSCEVLGVNPSDAYFLESQEGNFKIDAVLVHPKLNLATQKGLFVFVQGRPVQDKLLNQALIEGYSNLVLDHYFPQAVVV
jgi:DNA mismatch repair protein MutL